MKIYQSVEQLIGHTPLVELRNIERAHFLKARLLVKLEEFNPAGSAKDRAALRMLDAAKLPHGAVIIEPTSGSTGIALAALGAARGARVIIVMPENMSAERRRIITSYGAEVIVTPSALGMSGAVEKAEALKHSFPGAVIPGQFANPANARAHYETTGPEIWEDTDGRVDIFVAGVGTGGTISGAGRYLKEQDPDIRIIAVEPEASPMLSRGIAGEHDIQGIGANFVPKLLDRAVIDDIVTVSTDDAFAAGRELARREGILVGISSGAAIHAAITLAAKDEYCGKTVVALAPDSGERYLSTAMYAQEDE